MVVGLTSERDEYFVEVNGRDLADLKNNIQEFLTDYQNSIFIIKRVMTRIMHTQYQWDLMPEQESQAVKEIFQQVIEVESSNYKAEVKRIQSLQRKDDLLHAMQGFSFEYALFHKLLLIGLMTCLGLNIMRENYWLVPQIIVAVVVVFLSHQKKVEKQKMQGMFRDLKNLDNKS